MFERFTTDAREVVIRAQMHARRAHDRQITGRHLVLALLDPESPVSDDLRDLGVRAEAMTPPAARESAFTDSDTDALRVIGVDLDAVRRAVEETFGPGALDRPVTPARRWWHRRRDARASARWHIPFSAGAKRSLESSLREGIRLGTRSLAAEHLVLGVLRADDPDVRLPRDVVTAVRVHFESRLRDSA